MSEIDREELRGLLEKLRRETPRPFLLEAARYFENRSTGGEDKAHWANVYNAKNCREYHEWLVTLAAAYLDLLERVERYEEMIELYLTDTCAGTEHQAVDWNKAFRDLLPQPVSEG